MYIHILIKSVVILIVNAIVLIAITTLLICMMIIMITIISIIVMIMIIIIITIRNHITQVFLNWLSGALVGRRRIRLQPRSRAGKAMDPDRVLD